MPSRLQHLDRDACLARLAAGVVGRLAVLDGGAPTILPVNYVLDGETIVFRTDPGLKLSAGPRSPVSFEIDEIDRSTRSGWSVVVSGHLHEVTRYDRTWHRVIAEHLEPWAGGPKEHWMRLVPTRITGRILALEPAALR